MAVDGEKPEPGAILKSDVSTQLEPFHRKTAPWLVPVGISFRFLKVNVLEAV